MAFNTSPGRAEYTAIAGQTVFPFSFKIFSDTDIKVYLTPSGQDANDTTDLLVLTTEYTVTINGDLGGEVTLVSPASSGDKITALRSLPIDRNIEYQTSGDLLADTLNADQEYQTYLTLDQVDANTRHISLSESTQGVSNLLPSPDALAILGWSSNKDKLQNFTVADDGVFVNILNIDSISELSSVNPLIYSTVNVRGYYTPNDGGGGIFNYDATQSAVNNGGTIINGWVRQFNGAVEIVWFGIGTGDDAIPINEAILYASLNNIKNVTNNHYTVSIDTEIIGKDNVTFNNYGKIIIASDMAGSQAINGVNATNFKFIGGEIEVIEPTYSKNIFLFSDGFDCLVRDVDIIDGGIDRYPLAPIRSLRNNGNRYENINISSVKGIAVQSYEDVDCDFKFIKAKGDGNKTLIETNDGESNLYVGCSSVCILNTATSAFGFNDKNSVAMGNRVKGGASSLTVGHAVPFEADYSVVMGNVVSDGSVAGLNIQASEFATIIGNTVKNTPIGLQGTIASKYCTVIGNTFDAVTTDGVRAGQYYTLVGNIERGATTGYRPHGENKEVIAVGNVALNGSGTGFQWNIGALSFGTLVGNFAGDEQITPTMVTGFKAAEQSLMIGNSTDGNATFRQFDGNFSSIYAKDLSVATRQVTPSNSGLVGGTGSAGAGTQYIGLEISGVTYKFLHDGTV